MKNDFNLAYKAVLQNGYAFQHISNEHKNNKEIQLLALEDDKITNKGEILSMFPNAEQFEKVK